MILPCRITSYDYRVMNHSILMSIILILTYYIIVLYNIPLPRTLLSILTAVVSAGLGYWLLLLYYMIRIILIIMINTTY